MQEKELLQLIRKATIQGSGRIFQSDLFLYEGSVSGGHLNLDE